MFEEGSTVAVAGSRRLSSAAAARVAALAGELLDAGHSLAVGCCTGADEAVLRAALARGQAHQLEVLCAFGPGGAGACGWSAVAAVEVAAAHGARVVWWAGGGCAVPVAARLAKRTRAVAAAGAGGVLVCFGSPASRGSVLACREALRLGRPLRALSASCSVCAVPLPKAGVWRAVGRGGLLEWVPRQGSLL